MFVNYLKRWHIGTDASGLTHYGRNDRATCNHAIVLVTRRGCPDLTCEFCSTRLDMEALPAGLWVTCSRGTGRVGRSDELYSEVWTGGEEYFVAENWCLTVIPPPDKMRT